MNKVRDFNFTRFNEHGKIISPFEDTPMREVFIAFALQTWNVVYVSGGLYGIDLVLALNPLVGAEGEEGSWSYDRWRSGQADIFRLGIHTLNLQNGKWHYWGIGEFSDKNHGFFIGIHPGQNENIYFRMNKQKDQICIVDAETIKNFRQNKIVFNEKVGNSNVLEDFICIPKEFVKTYNLQPDGTWLLNGPYRGMTPQEFDRVLAEENKQRAIGGREKYFEQEKFNIN